MPYDSAATNRRNKQHALNPQVGDYWQEMFNPVALVVKVEDGVVHYAVARFVGGNGSDRYDREWDTKNLRRGSVEDFARSISYKGRELGDTHCDVVPDSSYGKDFPPESEWGYAPPPTPAHPLDAITNGLMRQLVELHLKHHPRRVHRGAGKPPGDARSNLGRCVTCTTVWPCPSVVEMTTMLNDAGIVINPLQLNAEEEWDEEHEDI